MKARKPERLGDVMKRMQHYLRGTVAELRLAVQEYRVLSVEVHEERSPAGPLLERDYRIRVRVPYPLAPAARAPARRARPKRRTR